MRTPRLANPARAMPNARDAEPWQHRKYQELANRGARCTRGRSQLEPSNTPAVAPFVSRPAAGPNPTGLVPARAAQREGFERRELTVCPHYVVIGDGNRGDIAGMRSWIDGERR